MKLIILLLAIICCSNAQAGILVFSPSTGAYTTKADLTSAAQDGDTAGKTIIVTSALTAVQSNISSATLHAWPSDRALKVEKGGSIACTTKFAGLPYAEPEWFGAFPDGNVYTTAMNTVAAVANTGTQINFRAGTYLTATPWNFTIPVKLIGVPGTRIKLSSGSNAYVLQLNGTGGSPAYMIKPVLRDLILDGGGHATDGLVLKGTVSGEFSNIRTTNVTGAGLHAVNLGTQSAEFRNYKCSSLVEAFTTQPANGILIDGTGDSSSNNTFVNPVIEGVSGSGIKWLSAINNVVINGTSESNNVAIELGETAPSAGTRAADNTFIGMDNESNTATLDVILRATAYRNTFNSIRTGGMSFLSAGENNVFGGVLINGATLDTNSYYNFLSGVAMYSTGATITDNGSAGSYNSYLSCHNTTDVKLIPDKGIRRRQAFTVAAAGTATIDASLTTNAQVICTGSTATIAVPTNPADGQDLTVEIFNTSGVALTVTWASSAGGFKMSGWLNPTTGNNAVATFHYDKIDNWWYLTSLSPTNAPSKLYTTTYAALGSASVAGTMVWCSNCQQDGNVPPQCTTGGPGYLAVATGTAWNCK